MDTKKKRIVAIILRISKWLISSQRIRKFKNMKQYQFAFLLLGAFLIILLMHWIRLDYNAAIPVGMPFTQRHNVTSPSSTTTDKYYIKGTPMKPMPLNGLYKEKLKNNDDRSSEYTKPAFVVDTPGCQIPFNMINYEKYVQVEKKLKRSNCGRRAVLLNKVDGSHVKASINKGLIKNYLNNSARYECNYRFIRRSNRFGPEKTKNEFSRSKKFNDGDIITLATDFVNVRCFEYDAGNKSRTVYDDIFPFTKRINATARNRVPPNCEYKYNVLMLGIDSMSLPRFVQTMPRTRDFLHQNFWLAYRGFHKIGDNTLPNLMAILTGDNMETFNKKCQNKMDKCNVHMMWSKFKDEGYVTAYGEDFLLIPDTFSNTFEFHDPPTDHYMKPFFLERETQPDKSLVCAGKAPSGQHILDYATDFVTTYQSDRFFGFFWINSFSHNENSRPQDADRLLEKFFNKIRYTGILHDTFIIFLSGHGVRFGRHRMELESYYDERLPFFFLWTPTKFKGMHRREHQALAINQFRLIAPYDLYNTLMNIKVISNCDNWSYAISEACPLCDSLFVPVDTSRQCSDLDIHEKWCSCHRLYPLDLQAKDEGMKSVMVAAAHIRKIIKSIRTKRCWRCQNVALKNVLRIHYYYDSNKSHLYYVVAFTMGPGYSSYEAIVKKSQIVGSISIISPYRGTGHCASETRSRDFCICEQILNCK